MDTSFLKLATGTRIKNVLGLQLVDGYDFVFGKNYLYLEIPALPPEEPIKRNQHVFVKAAGTVDPKGKNIVYVEPNRNLAEVAYIQPGYMLHPEEGVAQLGFWMTARKDIDLSDYPYLVRVYLFS